MKWEVEGHQKGGGGTEREKKESALGSMVTRGKTREGKDRETFNSFLEGEKGLKKGNRLKIRLTKCRLGGGRKEEGRWPDEKATLESIQADAGLKKSTPYGLRGL